MLTRGLLLSLFFLTGCFAETAGPEPPAHPEPGPPGKPQLEAHTISVALDPATHSIEGTDELSLKGAGTRELDLELNASFTVSAVTLGRLASAFTLHDGVLHVEFPVATEETFTVTVAYKGTLFDPPKRDEARFVVGEKCSGTIQPEGAFLPGSAGWYPVLGDSMARFTVTAKVPADWEFVGQGARHDYDAKTRRATWCNPLPADRLDCVAGPYVSEELKAGRVTVRSYFYKDDAATAEAYRKAAADWIAYFSKEFGPYAFDDFSVVENFFSTGFGMPSYTLLGADVVRMGPRYLGEGGLGHEVLHCWWGNGVFVSGGNWCEAATVYGSNYGWLEHAQGADAARNYRRRDMVRFAMFVNEKTDYPVRKFLGKTTESDNEIGYTKGSMLFHHVRRIVGDAAFSAAMKRVFRERVGTRATWDDFRHAFEAESGEKLEKAFTAWLDEKGAPVLTATRTATGVRLTLTGPLRDARVHVRSHVPTGPVDADVDIKDGAGDYTTPMEAMKLHIDPDWDLFRALAPGELPLCLNRVVTDETRAVVLPADAAPYADLLPRLEGWEQIKAAEATPEKLKGKSLLVLGGPDTNALAKRWVDAGPLVRESCSIRADGWTTAGETVKLGADRALLVTIPSPDDAARRATIFFPASAAATKPARLLLYYGWDSWVVWRDGKIAARGEFEVEHPLTVDLK